MKKVAAVIVIIVVIMLVGLGVWYFANSPNAYAGEPESITIGTPSLEIASLIFIADDRGYFSENGLNVTIKDYNTSVEAIDGMENGAVDISVSTEYPIVGAALDKENISIIGNIDKYQTTYLVGRKDLGIEKISDLNGKKIGVTRSGIGEFYLGRFLDLHGLSIQNVTLIDIQQSQTIDALKNGSIDAAMIWSIDENTVEEQLGSNAAIWPAQSEQPTDVVLACKNDLVQSHPEAIDRFLKSISMAEDYSIGHPAKAQAIIQDITDRDAADMASIWPNHQFSLSLDQSLIVAMEDEGRWMIHNNLTSERTIPDFRNYIYTKGMGKVKPDSMNIY